MTWIAPATAGRPAVSDYDLRYKLVSETTFTNGPQDVSGISATIGDLTPASSYDVQVRASNDEGNGPWSASQSGMTTLQPSVRLILSSASISDNRGMSTVTATVSPTSPTAFSLNVWIAAFPPIPGQFATSANNILSFAANETQSSGEIVITGLVPSVVNVTGAVSPPGVLVKPPALVRLQITDSGTTTEPKVTTPVTTGGGGGGGGPPPVPIPSDKDFDWNVTRDIEELDRENDLPTGIWSDGKTLWVLGERVQRRRRRVRLRPGDRRPTCGSGVRTSTRRNRFSHGIWSDGKTLWIADSGQDQTLRLRPSSQR